MSNYTITANYVNPEMINLVVIDSPFGSEGGVMSVKGAAARFGVGEGELMKAVLEAGAGRTVRIDWGESNFVTFRVDVDVSAVLGRVQA